MAFEIIHSGEKEKWQLPFMRQTNRKCKYRFLNYDQYDCREALKTFIQPSFFLMVTMKKITFRKCWKIQRLLNLLLPITAHTLTNTTIRGINDLKPQHVMENPSTFSLPFKDKYNFKERKLKTRGILDIRRYRLEREFRKKVEKGKKKLRQKRSDEFDENDNRIYKNEEGNIIPTFNISANGKHNNVEPKDLGLRNLFGEYNDNETNHPVPQDRSGEKDEKE